MALRIRFLEIAENIRSSYWFIPALMAIGGLAGGSGLVLLDARMGEDWLQRLGWFYGNRPDGAREVLSTIASSTITVAGVVFSVTLAAVTYASGQHGPRLLTNFQRDRGNQATLGTFIATFLYCLVVLRTVRAGSGASATGDTVAADAFVPNLAVYGALLLALASIVMLIYFVHHVTESIHINSAVARIGKRLIHDIRNQTDKQGDAAVAEEPALENTCAIAADETGYIEAVDLEALAALACRHDLVLRLVQHPGNFVHAGGPLLEVAPAARANESLTRDCNKAFAVGPKRTPLQDLCFAIDELVEIATRALSPGVSDPFTAMACIDWLGAAIAELGHYAPERYQLLHDERGELRVIFRAVCFEDYVRAAFGQLRPYAARDPNVRMKLLAVLDLLIRDSPHHCRLALCAERRCLDNSPAR